MLVCAQYFFANEYYATQLQFLFNFVWSILYIAFRDFRRDSVNCFLDVRIGKYADLYVRIFHWLVSRLISDNREKIANYLEESKELHIFAAETLFIHFKSNAYEKEFCKKIDKKLLS